MDHEGLLLSLPLLLKNWLEDLQESGVDLEEYGRVESELYQQEHVDWDWSGDESNPDGTSCRATWIITSLEYGPSSSDWKIEVDYQIDRAVEDIGKIPGGWVEDDDSDGEDDSLDAEDDGSVREDGEMEEGCGSHQAIEWSRWTVRVTGASKIMGTHGSDAKDDASVGEEGEMEEGRGSEEGKDSEGEEEEDRREENGEQAEQ